MKPFTEEARYEYPLTPDSLVIDVGAHVGTFSRIISEKYGCRARAFEPVDEFYQKAKEQLKQFPNVKLACLGVGSSSRLEWFFVKGDSTGLFAQTEQKQVCYVVCIDHILDAFGNPDLLKLNCEGGEYEILERILEAGLATRIRNIQVQFHAVVPNWEARYKAIREGLLKTHHLTWESSFTWENYELTT